MRRLPVVCAVVFAALSIHAQAPSDDWRTIATDHFRIHYPVEYQSWTERAASRLESIFEAVSTEVGYRPQTPIDVLVGNPIAQANGSAWPFLDTPRIIIFTEPPGPEGVIGAYSNWIDLLAVHEVAHIVHMLRPSRNPLQQLIEQYILPLNRITLDAPRWVLEGYATVVEGRLTGAGRPSSTMRALILRQWAAHGRLPSYDQLDTDQRFLGLSMAYLAGSAFLEWLEARRGPESLRSLWTRMTARQRRSFDSAFAGVFGETPERLYGQFTAELTASAVAVNRSAELREGELWQETKWASGDPAVSRDGQRIVVVLREREKPAKLVVWATGAAEKEETEYRERIEKMLERDPEDIAPLRTKPLDRDPLHSFTSPDGGDLSNPRWMPDGKSILVTHRQPDPDGFLHHDLFLWNPEEHSWRRITHLADVHDADPYPNGRRAVAVRSRFGFSQLVDVDIATGEVTERTPPSLDHVYDHPRVSPDGSQVAYVEHSAGRWSLVIGNRRIDDESYASPEWMGADVIATQMSRGFAELVRVSPAGPPALHLTRTLGGALGPAPSPDGRIFFMSLDPRGFVLRVVDGSSSAPSPQQLDDAFVPAIPPRAPEPRVFAAATVPPSQPYGFGRQELTFIGGANFAPDGNATELGIRFGDVIGRLDTIAVASFGGDEAVRGVGVASAWRGWPVEVSGHLFRAEEREIDRSGAELRAMWDFESPRSRIAAESGVLAGDPFDLAFADARFSAFRVSPSWRLSHEVSIGYDEGSFRQLRGSVTSSIRRNSASLVLAYERRRLDDDEHAIELGGLPSTIIPRSAFSNRVFEPGLPAGSLRGDDYHGVRVEATVPGIPLTLFYRLHDFADQVALAGAQIELSSDPIPILHLPGLDVTLGVARPVSGVLERDTNWWLGLRWRP